VDTENMIPLGPDNELFVHDPIVPLAENPGLRLHLSDCGGYPPQRRGGRMIGDTGETMLTRIKNRFELKSGTSLSN
jgi:hypothetical protein